MITFSSCGTRLYISLLNPAMKEFKSMRQDTISFQDAESDVKNMPSFEVKKKSF